MKAVKKSSFTSLVKYLTGEQGKEERVGFVLTTNCHQDNPLDAALEIQAVQAMNRRAESDKTYHMIVSFRAGESPSQAVISKIEEEVCKELGFEGHQRVSVVHTDTDNLHIHIAVNKIHPETLTIHDPFQDHKKLANVCERLEIEHDLEIDNHHPQKRGAENRADDMEHHSGIESLMGWVRRECLDAIKQAESWGELHKVLADAGLELQRKGNGFVLVSEEGMAVKASTVDRVISKNSLEDRLGGFVEKRGGYKNTPKKAYRANPVKTKLDTTELYQTYKSDQDARKLNRKKVITVLKNATDREVATLNRSLKLKRSTLKLAKGGGLAKRMAYAGIKRNADRAFKEIKERQGREVKRINEKYRRLTWADWLRDKANGGDQEALKALRAREGRELLKTNTISATGNPDPSLKSGIDFDSVTKKGTIIYSTGEGVVKDDGERVKVSDDFGGKGIGVAVKLAGAKGDKLTVTGSQGFRAAVVREVADSAINVSFENERMEAQRIKQAGLSEEQKKKDQAVRTYVAERNKAALSLNDISKHRGRRQGEEGRYFFSGLRQVEGQSLALLKKDNEVVVVSLKDEAAVRRLKRLSLGDQVSMAGNGSIITKQGRSRK